MLDQPVSRVTAPLTPHAYTRAQTKSLELFRTRLRNHDWDRLGGGDGRLAGPRRPTGAMLGFGLGGVLLLPVSYVYGERAKGLPDASGEAAYTRRFFPRLSAISRAG